MSAQLSPPSLGTDQPTREEFFNPFARPEWLRYFSQLLRRFDHIRFVGLPSLKDIPNVPLDRLYVPLDLSRRYVDAEQAKDAERTPVLRALAAHRRLVVLGDPGAGKSTLVSYLVSTFAGSRRHAGSEDLGPLIPVPMVLREMRIEDGLTFESLLTQFRRAYPDLPEEGLDGVLASGQALILFDGVDEIGDVTRRKALRKAVVEQGIARYPDCAWLLTSRIVGYDEVPFDLPVRQQARVFRGGSEGAEPEVLEITPVLKRLYVLPFTTRQIRQFAENWYSFRETEAEARHQGVRSLLTAIESSPSIERLAHTPNLLQIIALIHRIYTTLPSGKSELYDRICQAYLESIDTARGFHETDHPHERHLRWLGRLAFDMQQRRAQADNNGAEILVPESEILTAIGQGLGIDPPAAARELSYIARRSGLLLPRGPALYTFAHLSFQEYFAAGRLFERLLDLDEQQDAIQETKLLAQAPIWHETLIFLFEKLAKIGRNADHMFVRFFLGEEGASVEKALLALELVADERSGLSVDNRRAAIELTLAVAQRKYSEIAVSRINSLNELAWHEVVEPAIEREVRKSTASPSVEWMLFLQGLSRLKAIDLDTWLGEGGLSAISDKDLYFLTPLAWSISGAARREMVARMPIAKWFSSLFFYGSEPLLAYACNEGDNIRGRRESFLVFCWNTDQLAGLLSVKLLLLGASDLSSREVARPVLARTRDLARDRAWNRTPALDEALERAVNHSLDSDLSSYRAWERARDLTRQVAQARSRANPLRFARVLGQARAQSLARAEDIARVPDRRRDLALDQALENAVWRSNSVISCRGVASRAAVALLETQVAENLGELPECMDEQVVWHLARLVLGQGTSDDWRGIEALAGAMAEPNWQRQHMPYLRAGEVETALDLLGLRRKNGENLFEAAWFEPGHVLAPALNATPSEFWATVERLRKEPDADPTR